MFRERSRDFHGASRAVISHDAVAPDLMSLP